MREFEEYGTRDELVNILQEDYSFSETEAKISVFLMTKESDEEEKKYRDLWYLGEDITYQATFGEGRYTINLSELKNATLKRIIPIAISFIDPTNLTTLGLIGELVVMIWEHISKVSDNEMCVLMNMLLKKDKLRYFSLEDMTPNTFKGECINHSDKFICSFLSGDNCNIEKEDIEVIAFSLCEKNILERSVEGWKIVV